ncbi:EthD family reductase [Pseudodonghicola xiamenensis]|uniref:Ethyl tert-butyl ether degradation protein EthD n=1 Tax=Pseudodonghicola xiamenensis TaxID=337702 RepID=A0A8J3MDT1_9RHOB|nr:EthD family reductase [Pseudodonghicola xiamenensis]GHG93682.1 ethyl tert-butyl ether degradation protein EthD [Pseudodonghicola xiamenensis]
MAVSLQIIYPASRGTRFDHDYYLGTHLPLVDSHMGAHIDRVLVTKGIAGGPDVPPPYHAVATIVFADRNAMTAALRLSGPVNEDVANFTDVQPQILIGEVIA